MNKIKKCAIFCLFLFILFNSFPVFPCTTFVLKQGQSILFGRNFDWCTGTGLLITNPRDLQKVALVEPPEKPAKWISKYGSITFNQIGRELPFGGINEAGLVVEHMTLETTVYPPKDHRPSIQACQWIQYQLDNFSTVNEVIQSDESIRIAEPFSKFHFLVSDKLGNVAVIEFINGKMVSYSGNNLPVPVLANSTYDESMNCYNNKADVTSNRSLYHFVTAAKMLKQNNQQSDEKTVDAAFEILSKVSEYPGTKWSIVYDITDGKIYFKMFETPTIIGERKIFLKTPGNEKVKYIDIKQIDFNNLKTSQVVDLYLKRDGCNNSYLSEYTTELNRKSIFQAFTFYKQWGIPIEISDKNMIDLSSYPESFELVE